MRPLVFLLSFALVFSAPAHDGLDIEAPVSEPEAWNTVQLCSANIETLIGQEQWGELPVQLAIVAQAARYLRERSTGLANAKWVEFDNLGFQFTRAALLKQGQEVKVLWTRMRTLKEEVEKGTDPAVARAAVFACPVCRGIREFKPEAECIKCGMKVVPRMIPASSLYNTPGEPSVVMTPTLEAPLAPLRQSKVRIKFTRKKDGAPLVPEDLQVVHTERIHLLIVDESLGDYHRIHPAPAGEPGVYEFSMTPRRQGPYRVFADILPVASNVQEYATCDLPATKPKGDATFRAGLPTSGMAEGMRFQIQWNTAGQAIPAKQPVNGLITVLGRDRQPFKQLEPLLGTYAHLVAFHEDRQTVLHLHPTGGVEPKKPEDRGGPRFTFRFWAPKPGFYRLYVQVKAEGRELFAPFAVNVE